MPDLFNKQTQRLEYVPGDKLQAAKDSGLYDLEGVKTTVASPSGRVSEVSIEDALTGELTAATGEQRAAAEEGAHLEEKHGGFWGKLNTFGEAAASSAFPVVYDALGRVIEGDDYATRRAEQTQVNEELDVAGSATGLVPGLLAGGSGAVGAAARGTGIGQIARAGTAASKGVGGGLRGVAAGAFLEGGLIEAGAGAQKVLMSEDPLDIERWSEVLPSHFIHGGVTSGALGVGGTVTIKAVGKGLARTRGLLDDVATKAQARANVADDLVGKDLPALRATREAEEEALKTIQVTERATVADDIAKYRQASIEAKPWLALKGEKDRLVRTIGRDSLDADRMMDKLLRNPKGLAEKPVQAMRSLQQQENALERLAARTDDIKAKIVAEGGDLEAAAAGVEGAKGANRMKALSQVDGLLEQNRALQQRITAAHAPPASPRLTQIDDAIAVAQQPVKKGLIEKSLDRMGSAAAYGAVAGFLPGGIAGALGAAVAPEIARKVVDVVVKRFGRAGAEAALRSSKALDAFLDVSGKAAKATPVVASKVLASLSYGPPEPRRPGQVQEAPKKKTSLLDAYRAREKEILSQVTVGPDGQPMMKLQARQELAGKLAAIRVVSPVVADRIETHKAKRIEFLARKIPKRPDIMAAQTGPDRWQPSELQMRAFARYAAAAEDPGGIEERMSAGTVTPEDAEVMRELYPERLADLQRRVYERLPELRASLPYARRLSFSILTGIPVDPALVPQVLKTLQSQFVFEPGTEGGTEAPKAQPAFGSVSKPDPTRAQERAQ